MPSARMFHRARGQCGDADPLLTIGAMVATLIVGTAIVGSVMALMNIGSKFTADQVNATNVSSARDTFARDAQNATAVSAVTNSSVRFTQNPSGSAISSDRGTSGKTCRVSDWKSVQETNGSYTLVNTVWQTAWNGAAKSCAGTAGNGFRTLSVTGFPAAPTLTYVNAAGAAITFNAAGFGSTPVRPSNSYYTVDEWASSIPKTITLTGQMDSNSSGTKPSILIGVTNLKEVHSALAPVGTEPKPTREVFDPAPPRIVSVVRSKTVGALYAGQREGLSVTWDGVLCGPYTTRYDVKYTPTTPGVATQTSSVTTYALRITRDFDRVPNGARGVVSVTATCPAGVSKKPATSQKTFDQSLPAPVLTNRVLTADIHQLSWTGGLSSLPLSYTPFAKHSTQPNWAYSAPTIPANSFDWGWTPGYTYGVSNYMVRASVNGGLTADSNRSDATVAWPGPAPSPLAWSSDTGGAVYDQTLNWGGINCWAGTTPQYNPVFMDAGQGWRNSFSLRVLVDYATTYAGGVQTRCVSAFGELSPVGSVSTSWRTNDPPPPVPNVPGVSGSWQKGTGGGGTTSVAIYGVSYANQYEFGSILFGTFGITGWSSQYVGSPGSYAGRNYCGAGVATSASGRARAGGVSGWSDYNSAELQLTGVGMGCS